MELEGAAPAERLALDLRLVLLADRLQLTAEPFVFLAQRVRGAAVGGAMGGMLGPDGGLFHQLGR